jgi:sterol desaturase/sphingolipid hydroxylase (fatty acid hydroxylase superfamily)
MSPSQIIVLATPVFLLAIALEWAWGRARGRDTYRLNDAISSIGLGMLSQLTAVFLPLLTVGIYTAVQQHLRLVDADAFWMSWIGWPLALVFYDFCYYWEHRASHRVSAFWGSHVVHHQSQDYNLSTALRQPVTRPLFNWLFYLPMALAGVPPLVFGIVTLVDLLYQFWVHTEHVPRLGWFDRWFCSPSNHRVHHGVNDRYLDRNYGGILMVWDRLFGTFQEEDERCVYGTRQPLDSWDPLWSNAQVYAGLARDSWRTRRWSDKLQVWLRPPGWQPADLAAAAPRPPFDLAAVSRFHPPLTRGLAAFAVLQFAVLLGGVAVFLWFAAATPLPVLAVWLLVLCAGLWCVGAVMQGRIGRLQALALEAAAVGAALAVLAVLR